MEILMINSNFNSSNVFYKKIKLNCDRRFCSAKHKTGILKTITKVSTRKNPKNSIERWKLTLTEWLWRLK